MDPNHNRIAEMRVFHEEGLEKALRAYYKANGYDYSRAVELISVLVDAIGPDRIYPDKIPKGSNKAIYDKLLEKMGGFAADYSYTMAMKQGLMKHVATIVALSLKSSNANKPTGLLSNEDEVRVANLFSPSGAENTNADQLTPFPEMQDYKKLKKVIADLDTKLGELKDLASSMKYMMVGEFANPNGNAYEGGSRRRKTHRNRRKSHRRNKRFSK